MQAYFNRPDVQAALHANRSQHALPYGPWQGCSTIVNYSQCGPALRMALPGSLLALCALATRLSVDVCIGAGAVIVDCMSTPLVVGGWRGFWPPRCVFCCVMCIRHAN